MSQYDQFSHPATKMSQHDQFSHPATKMSQHDQFSHPATKMSQHDQFSHPATKMSQHDQFSHPRFISMLSDKFVHKPCNFDIERDVLLPQLLLYLIVLKSKSCFSQIISNDQCASYNINYYIPL